MYQKNHKPLSRMASNLTPQNIATKFAMMERIIDATHAEPTIMNEASQFVVVTYWWGRGRENLNTARPCGDFYESLLDKPRHLLSPMTASPEKYRTALLRNPKFTEFVQKKVTDYQGVLRAYIQDGKPLSNIYTEKTSDQIKEIVLTQILDYVETVLPLIQEFQQVFLERADLEDTFKHRLEKGLTATTQLDTIRQRLGELKSHKDGTLKEIKARIGPFKSAMDKQLRYADPISYEGMIANWETSCAKSGCNYLAVEYSPFAESGGYQLAINAKPRFIQKALEICKGRGVLYIDGDMTVNRYPSIFDMQDVDFMARGWNIDPRSSYMHNESILVDPYIFETSGGTMFFGATPEAYLLLLRWIEISEKWYQWGKADDRILSLVFNTYKLLLPLKIMQLPIEYLWLSLDYDDSIAPELVDNKAIFLEHPECLTTEETATGQGASSSRTPKFYATIEDSYPRSEYLHEAVLFPTAESAESFRPYLNYLTKTHYFEDVEDDSLIGEPPFHVIPFADGLGPFQSIANENIQKIQQMSSRVNYNTNGTMNNLAKNNRGRELQISEDNESTIPTILHALMNGMNVRYIPATSNPQYVISLDNTLRQFPRLEFAFVNSAKDQRRIFYFQSEFDVREPAFFATGSSHLLQLLFTCRTLNDLSERFHNGYQFLSRIRTTFLKRFRNHKMETNSYRNMQGGAYEPLAEEAEEGLFFLYGDEGNQIGGYRQPPRKSLRKRRTLRKRKHSKRTRRV